MKVKDLLGTFDEDELIIIRDRNIEYEGHVYDRHIKALSNRIIKDSWKNSSHCTIIRLA